MEKTVIEYRGVRNVVAAILTKDDETELTYGDVFPVAGVAEVSKTVATSSDTHYYDDEPKIVISSVGNDEISLSLSAIPFDVLSKILGEDYDETTGVYTEGNADPVYCALGYITEDTAGNEYYVWRHKGKFSIPEESHQTKNEGTDAQGQSITYTGVNTIHKLKNGMTSRGIVYNASKGLIEESQFFAKVTNKDDISAD